ASWDFLTGYDFKTIKKLSIKSFRSLLQEPEPGDDQVTHGTNFYLVDPDGNIVKNYNGVGGQSKYKIMEDIVRLEEKDLLENRRHKMHEKVVRRIVDVLTYRYFSSLQGRYYYCRQ